MNAAAAGIFLFAPFLAQLDLAEVVRSAGLPGSKAIPALSYFLSFLALKLLGTERYAHVGGPCLRPRARAVRRAQRPAQVHRHVHLLLLPGRGAHPASSRPPSSRRPSKLGLYEGDIVNLDFHTMPHYGDESVLEKHWAGARGKVMKGALTLIAQDAGSKLMLYTASDIQREEADDQVLQFNCLLGGQVRNGRRRPMFIFDSRLTTYKQLSALNRRRRQIHHPAPAGQEAGPGHRQDQGLDQDPHPSRRSGNSPTPRSMPPRSS